MALNHTEISANGANGHHKFTLYVTEDSTSVANNTSSVSWSLVISPIVNSYDWISNSGKVSYSVNINGNIYSGIIATYDGWATVTLKGGTVTCWHDAAGAATIGFSFSITDNTGWNFAPGNASASGSLALTTIPRQATVTTAPNFNDEENPTITYSNPAGVPVALCITLGNGVATLPYQSVNTAGTFTYSLDEAARDVLRSASPNSNTLRVGFCLHTHIGGTDYYDTKWGTMTIVNADPIIDPVVTDTNADTAALTDGAALIRYYSNAYFETGARAQKGATITSQRVTCGGVNLEGASGTFVGVQSGDFVFTVTDSRENTTVLPVQIPFVDYVGLSCSIGNSKPDTDGDFTLTASGVCYNGDIASAGSNDLYVLYRFKVSGGEFSDWMDMSIVKGDNSYTATADFTGLDYQATYIFQCKAGDLVTTATTDEVAIKSVPVFDWSEADFNFNVPVSVPDLQIGGVWIDDICENGTKDGWIYRRWRSGVMECWKTLVYKTAINNQWGSLYLSPTATARQNYPYPFTGRPIENVSVQGNQPVWVICASGGNGVNGSYASACYHLCSPGSHASIEHYLSLHVIGYWKQPE